MMHSSPSQSKVQSKKTHKPAQSEGMRLSAVAASRARVTKKAPSPYMKKLKRYTKQGLRSMLLSPVFHSSFKVISVALLAFGALYASYFYISKSFANEVVVSQSEIVARVAMLTTLPNEEPNDIVRVQDEEVLRKQNPFYKDVKEGDYILMYKNTAIIYDLRNNVIVALKRTK